MIAPWTLVERDIVFEKSVGEKVRAARVKLGWSQQFLADTANLEQNQIQRVENAKNTTSLAIIVTIAKALGKQPFELLKTDMSVKVNKNLERVSHKRAIISEYIFRAASSSYLNDPRSVLEIVQYCKNQYEAKVPSSATSAVLKKMVDAKFLKRIPASIKGRYLYQRIK